ncbi:MAG: YjgP/YjgQ family permease [Bacteroidetes bacterium]|nr:MAG: YjgP/YjgQ family permease [Bacteroidota bacterium]MBL1145188.1 YjgP/YjgQ family permease [Bacteroidota bacterium]MCB0802920.1 LptF/LptG family permease [Flavobacteriales bacterium]NOG57984.1 YjgP/YjgQ family permease [Bacteroidota bacterium]
MYKLDFYIIKKFLGTFFFSIALIISISIVFDFSENVDEFIERDAPTKAIIFDYYLNFIPYFANLFSPLFIFISVIFFTSKMASNTEIIAILASGVSFRRFLRPYIISALILSGLSFYLNNFLIPKSNETRLNFRYTYIKNAFRNTDKNIHLQLDTNSFAYFESYSAPTDVGVKFSLERFNPEGRLTYKLISDYVKWDTSKNLWTIQNFYEREIHGTKEIIRKGLYKDTVLNMKPEEFSRRDTDVEMLDYFELNREIEAEKFKGTKMVVFYEIEKYRRFAFPFAAIILTLIGVAIASRKVRGGIGMHLGVGLLISFSFILFMKISQTFATNGGLHPMLAMWIPNIIYGFLALYLLQKAPK